MYVYVCICLTAGQTGILSSMENEYQRRGTCITIVVWVYSVNVYHFSFKMSGWVGRLSVPVPNLATHMHRCSSKCAHVHVCACFDYIPFVLPKDSELCSYVHVHVYLSGYD